MVVHRSPVVFMPVRAGRLYSATASENREMRCVWSEQVKISALNFFNIGGAFVRFRDASHRPQAPAERI